MRRTLSLLLCILMTLFAVSCSSDVRAEHCELGIVLPAGFEKIDTDLAFDLAYSDGEMVVGITRLSFDAVYESGIPATVSIREFAELYQMSSGMKQIIYDFGDTVFYSYTKIGSGTAYQYVPTFYKTPYAFFVITFIIDSLGWRSAEEALELSSSVYLINN